MYVLSLWWFACASSHKWEDTSSEALVDADADGYLADLDCDDLNPSVNAGEIEMCNGWDNNCDGHVDEDVSITFYADNDLDGVQDAFTSIL